jgi:hypothetical protein
MRGSKIEVPAKLDHQQILDIDTIDIGIGQKMLDTAIEPRLLRLGSGSRLLIETMLLAPSVPPTNIPLAVSSTSNLVHALLEMLGPECNVDLVVLGPVVVDITIAKPLVDTDNRLANPKGNIASLAHWDKDGTIDLDWARNLALDGLAEINRHHIRNGLGNILRIIPVPVSNKSQNLSDKHVGDNIRNLLLDDLTTRISGRTRISDRTAIAPLSVAPGTLLLGTIDAELSRPRARLRLGLSISPVVGIGIASGHSVTVFVLGLYGRVWLVLVI